MHDEQYYEAFDKWLWSDRVQSAQQSKDKFRFFPNDTIKPPFVPWVCKENVLSDEECDEVLEYRKNEPNIDLVVRGERMVKTWFFTEQFKEKYTNHIKKFLAGDVLISECSIKQWFQPSQLHSDGNGYDFTIYIPLEVTPAPNYVMMQGEDNINSSLVIFNGQIDNKNTLFLDVPNPETVSGRRICNHFDEVEPVLDRSIAGGGGQNGFKGAVDDNIALEQFQSRYNKFLFEHLPPKFRTLKRLNIFPFVKGLGIAFNPKILHCSNFWSPYLATRTHLLLACNLVKGTYWK